jgi:hypothetical protein
MHVYGILYDVDFLYLMISWSDKENLEMIVENKGCIIEGDPTYLVIIFYYLSLS